MAWAFRVSSIVAAPPERVWAEVSTPAGVNRELAPFLAMTWPRDVAALSPEATPLGVKLFRSWLLLFGVLPIDWDDLCLVSIEVNRGFLEVSSMATQRVWRHERTLAAEGKGHCRVTDEICFEPRTLTHLIAPIYWLVSRAVFAWRHHKLRDRFGAPKRA